MKRSPDRESLDFFRIPQPKRERNPHVPHQLSSVTSKDAAQKITPVFAGNRLACFRAIAASGEKGISRKAIAAAYFDSQQQYVTGPIRQLIEEGFVYEDPMRDGFGAIVTRDDNSVVPRKIDGSAVLLLTPKGKSRAA